MQYSRHKNGVYIFKGELEKKGGRGHEEEGKAVVAVVMVVKETVFSLHSLKYLLKGSLHKMLTDS